MTHHCMNHHFKIDATEPEMQEISQRYGVTGYPTLKLVRNGEVTDWKGESLYLAFVKKLENDNKLF